MRHFDFPPEVMTQIEHDRFHHADPQVQRRMEILRPTAHGQPHAEIATLAGVSRATVQRLLDIYQTGNPAAVRTFHWKVPASALTPHQPLLEAEFTARPTRVRGFLRDTMNLRRQKVAAVPVPPKLSLPEHAAKQAAFLKDGT